MNAFDQDDLDEEPVLGAPPSLPDSTWSQLLAAAVDPTAEPDLTLLPPSADELSADEPGADEPAEAAPFGAVADDAAAGGFGDLGPFEHGAGGHELHDGADDAGVG